MHTADGHRAFFAAVSTGEPAANPPSGGLFYFGN